MKIVENMLDRIQEILEIHGNEIAPGYTIESLEEYYERDDDDDDDGDIYYFSEDEENDETESDEGDSIKYASDKIRFMDNSYKNQSKDAEIFPESINVNNKQSLDSDEENDF